ncbi:SigB/SigF/SigG family RNA polymerase sigma factor [Streptomyces sp. R302]|uniref:RNA polymerase sigma factor SigF n=1 Tax=unclassified Streptomyces TaxID=2593676 RepID=UPI00145EF8BE|nr:MULTISPECIES: RNA polymerase sigma factor SigF [unclassified Streptomyces]NML54385.1 SigB/SigF/SigG family RNA polymerase sigma factor [Streptomyces sp. R301]NML78560.1 SigB/SigF/SigG family RNA polymerase sigma factor [Streptomyces sp. R302]
MDGAVGAGRQGRVLGRGGQHGLDQPVQTARRGARPGVRSGDATAGIPGQQAARPHEVATEQQADQMSEHEQQHDEALPTPAPASPPDGTHSDPTDSDSTPSDGTLPDEALPEEPVTEGDDAPRGHHAQDRSGARALFVELRSLPEGSPEKAELRNRLVRMHLPLVEHLARRFRNRGEPLDDLTQVATIGLIKSVDRFDPERGVEFSTYATPTVVGEIKRHFRDKGWAVRVPRRLQELRLSLTTATAELSQQHGRSPTVHELAERLGISEEEVLEGLESANAYSTLSLDVPDTDDESPAVADTLGAEDEALEGVEYRESLKPLLEDLPPREKRILLLRFFGNMTQSQIAQEVGISQMHVSRLLARTLAQLREKLLVEE